MRYAGMQNKIMRCISSLLPQLTATATAAASSKALTALMVAHSADSRLDFSNETKRSAKASPMG
jgi:hypothetical protein